GANGMAAVVSPARRLFGIAVAAQVGGDDGEILRQPWRNLMPGHVRERIAVHEQHRRAVAAVHGHDARAAGPGLRAGGAFEHTNARETEAARFGIAAVGTTVNV